MPNSHSKKSTSSSRPAKTRRIGPSHSPSHSPSHRSPTDATIISYLEHKLSRTFPELTISIHPNSGEKHDRDDIRGFSCLDNTKCECFNLSISNRESENHIFLDRLRYKYGDECALTGTEIMTRLVRVFRAMQTKGFPHKVQLYDRARVKVADASGKKHEIFLSYYYIMMHGMPWYAKFGFRTPQYEREMTANEETMNKAIAPQLLKRLGNLPKGTTFRQAAKLLDPQKNRENTEVFLELYEYLMNNKTNKLKYAYYDMWFPGTYGLSARQVGFAD